MSWDVAIIGAGVVGTHSQQRHSKLVFHEFHVVYYILRKCAEPMKGACSCPGHRISPYKLIFLGLGKSII